MYRRLFQMFCAMYLLGGSAVAARSDDTAATFNQANKLYEQGKFSEAAAVYQSLIRQGRISAPIYFNLGNAWFKSGNVGRAVFAYRKAGNLAPRDPDVRANLRFARRQIGTDENGEFKWGLWIHALTTNEWSLLAAASLWVWFLILMARQWRPEWKKSLRLSALVMGTITLVACAGLAVVVHDRFFVKAAIVIVPEASVRRGPFEESQIAFAARDGAEFRLLEQRDTWFQVADAQGRVGWLQRKDMVVAGNNTPLP